MILSYYCIDCNHRCLPFTSRDSPNQRDFLGWLLFRFFLFK